MMRSRPRLVALVAVAAIALGGGYLWLRDSSLVAVRHVKVTGLHGTDSAAIRRALRAAATDMTTLHLRTEQLRSAVAAFPVVKDIRVSTDLPHGLRIRVIRYEPVAAVVIEGRRVPVAQDGTVLASDPASALLPTVSLPGATAGNKLSDPRALRAVAMLGAAPGPLRALVSEVQLGPAGLQASLRSGPLIEFGPATRLAAKWDAAARVLGDPRSAGASYLDVRIPDRPVAGRYNSGASGGADATTSDGTTSGASDGSSGGDQAAVQ